jgi:hypothetical protein
MISGRGFDSCQAALPLLSSCRAYRHEPDLHISLACYLFDGNSVAANAASQHGG